MVAVVYSHSHADHFGGVRGVVDEADVRSGKVKVIAPVGFMDHAVAENVYAGNAMTRRMFYQYGVLLPRNPVRPCRPVDRQEHGRRQPRPDPAERRHQE